MRVFEIRWLPLLGLLILVVHAGCGGAADAPTGQVEPPAHVENARAETELATVTLTAAAEQRLGIETVEIEIREVRRSRSYGGVLAVPTGRSITISAPVAGTIAVPHEGSVPEPGSRLAAGQTVLHLLPLSDPGQDLMRLEAEAEARFEAAQLRATRAEQLLKDRAGSARAHEEAQAELAVAEATLRAVRSQLEMLNPTSVGEPGGGVAFALQSPVEARLGAMHVGIGQSVPASLPLFDLFMDDPLWIRVPVYVGDLESIDTARAAVVHGLGEHPEIDPAARSDGESGANSEARSQPGAASTLRPRTAEFVIAPPSANPTAATVDIFYELDNGDALFQPGQKVGVTLTLVAARGELEESLVAPNSAILYDIQGGTWVYESLPSHVYVRRRVEVSRVVGDLAVLARGPAAGTAVVTSGAVELFGTEFGVAH